MSIEQQIQYLLKAALNPEHLEIINESDKHAGHKQSPNSGQSHFKIIVISSAFEGMGRIARHQLIYKTLESLMNNPIHALSIRAYTTNEFNFHRSGG